MDQFDRAEHVAATLSPTDPVVCVRPHAATRSARWFRGQFPGTVFFAVKANPDPVILDAVAAGGVAHFDVASLKEVRDVRAQFPHATLAYMHPIKGPEAIGEAYHDHGVRIFAIDHLEELEKVRRATGHARDLTLCVRLSVDNGHAEMPMAHKFGLAGHDAIALMQAARQGAARLGITFHVGSQTMAPAAYGAAMDHVQDLVVRSGVFVDVVDVGGGFPAAYPGMEPPQLDGFVQEVSRRFETFLSSANAELWCEPGRALCAEASSLLVRVEARRGNALHLNDGVYGMLYDAGHFNWRYPARALGRSGPLADFSFYGPTCDDADFMPGPFALPESLQAGDYIEVGMVGAYGRPMASTFNGFGIYTDVLCCDDPFGSLYAPADGGDVLEISQ